MCRTPLISFWSISRSLVLPEIIHPFSLLLSLASVFFCSYKYTKSTLKTLPECTNNGNVIFKHLHFIFCVSAVGVELGVLCTVHCGAMLSEGQLKI